jgi:hypothetical protein
MLFRIPGLRPTRRTRSHRYRVPTIHSARAQRIHGGITNPVERANNMLRLHVRKESRRFNPNVDILEVCRDKNYEAFVRELLASEVREITGEYVPGHEQSTLFDIHCTQVLPETAVEEDSDA